MANKYENQITRSRSERDKAIIIEISNMFDDIREKSQRAAMKVTDKAGDNTEWFSDRAGRTQKFAKDLNEELRPDYLKKDNFSKQVYAEEYRTAYFESLYEITNEGIAEGYLIKLPRYTKRQFEQAINYPLSKLINAAKMKTGRNVDIEQVYTTIVSGVEQGLSLPKINKSIDVALGYRDSQTGKWIADKALRKGQTYKTTRTLRTEVLRMRSTAETDQWINQQPIVESKLQLVETLDDRTRSQSANMDGQIANNEGKFLYPNGQRAYAHRSGVAKWDINDRSTTITLDPDFPPESRIQRDVKTGKNKVLPFTNFKEYAATQNLRVNRYGEVLFK